MDDIKKVSFKAT